MKILWGLTDLLGSWVVEAQRLNRFSEFVYDVVFTKIKKFTVEDSLGSHDATTSASVSQIVTHVRLLRG